jgi:hypothetical protein
MWNYWKKREKKEPGYMLHSGYVGHDIGVEAVFENRELRRICGPKREEAGLCRKLYNDELHSLYSSWNIVRVIKLRMRWAGHVARIREGERCLQGFCLEARR